MAENLNLKEEASFSIGNEILKDLMGKVAEMGSVVKENTVHVKKASELASKLPVLEKQLEVLQDWVKRLKDGVGELEVKVALPAERMALLINDLSVVQLDLQQLRGRLSDHAQLFERPLRKEVHYRHFLGRPVLALFVMGMVTVFSFVLWLQARDRASDNAQADWKIRYLRLQPDSRVYKAIKAADDSWQADPDQFTKLVDSGEEEVRQYYIRASAQRRLDSLKAKGRK